MQKNSELQKRLTKRQKVNKKRGEKMNKIKELRTRDGLSQIELAKKMHVCQPLISHWETGKFSPRIPELMKLAQLFDCTVDDILRDEDPSEEETA